MDGFELRINVYAENEAEVADARAALVEFIDEHAKQGVAVTAEKIARAARRWKTNPFIRHQVTEYLKTP